MEIANAFEANPTAIKWHNRIENIANKAVRLKDRTISRRKALYDDENYEFVGGAKDNLRKKHYDKSLRLLWKAEQFMSWSNFKDMTRDEKELLTLSEQALDKTDRKELKKIRSQEYKDFLNQTYTPEQKQSIVNILSLIGHGEAYAWLVSAELLNEVQSTGGRAALTMQVMEEAKHFVVLRELLLAFECEIPRMSAWEYVLLENVFKSKGLEKFFGMNVLVEGLALSLFGMMGAMPGLEVLAKFHLDESRHTALPYNYFAEFPMTTWQKNSPARRMQRLNAVLPALPIIVQVEKDLGVIGIDAWSFAGSILRKIEHLSSRVGFLLPLPKDLFFPLLNSQFNMYCKLTRKDHKWQNYMESETTRGVDALKVEKEVFHLDDHPAYKQATA